MEETPLQRELREVRNAFDEFCRRAEDCLRGGASEEEIKRYVIALETVKLELRDCDAYSENR